MSRGHIKGLRSSPNLRFGKTSAAKERNEKKPSRVQPNTRRNLKRYMNPLETPPAAETHGKVIYEILILFSCTLRLRSNTKHAKCSEKQRLYLGTTSSSYGSIKLIGLRPRTMLSRTAFTRNTVTTPRASSWRKISPES